MLPSKLKLFPNAFVTYAKVTCQWPPAPFTFLDVATHWVAHRGTFSAVSLFRPRLLLLLLRLLLLLLLLLLFLDLLH